MQRRRANQQVFESDADTARCLLALDASGKLRDLYRHGMHHHVAPKLVGKGAPSIAVRIAPGSVDAMGQFHDGHNRERGVNFPLCRLHPFQNVPHTFPAALPGNEHAGVENYSHVEMLRGLRLLMISSRSAAKSGSSVGSYPSSLACASAKAMHSEIGRPRTASAGRTTAMALASRSMMTSAPARTRAMSAAKSLAASASEIRITLLAM